MLISLLVVQLAHSAFIHKMECFVNVLARVKSLMCENQQVDALSVPYSGIKVSDRDVAPNGDVPAGRQMTCVNDPWIHYAANQRYRCSLVSVFKKTLCKRREENPRVFPILDYEVHVESA